MIDLSEKYNPCLNLVYIYLMINRNMLGKANTSILDIQKDIFKTKNQSIIQKRTDEILDSYYIDGLKEIEAFEFDFEFVLQIDEQGILSVSCYEQLFEKELLSTHTYCT